MRHGAEFPCVEVPPEFLLGHVHRVHAFFEFLEPLLALAAADDLADAGEEHVHRGDGRPFLAVAEIARRVHAHVERLDLRGVTRDDHWLLEMLLDEVTLVLALQVHTPFHGELELLLLVGLAAQ